MEEKLFYIGLGIGGYALALRGASRLKAMTNAFWRAFWHGIFCAGAGGILTGLIGSTFNTSADPFRFALYGVVPGLLIGVVWSLWRKDDAEKILKEDLEWADTGFSAILLAAFIMYFFVQAFKIPSGSMRETFIEGDHLFVNKFIYGTRIPLTEKKIWHLRPLRRGDVVVFRFPSEDKNNPHHAKDFIKRAVGLPGETVEVRDKKVFINGEPLKENYVQYVDRFMESKGRQVLSSKQYQDEWEKGNLVSLADGAVRDNFGPIRVPSGYYFAMGDNRDRSYDSRFWGPLPDTYVKGKAWLVYWPPKRIKIIR